MVKNGGIQVPLFLANDYSEASFVPLAFNCSFALPDDLAAMDKK
jgi:hypothetical protein